MNRRRVTHRGLTGSRIYPKRRRYFLFSAVPVENPKTGKVSKWHSLCLISDGEERARELASAIVGHNADAMTEGDMPQWVEKYRLKTLAKREDKRPKEAARAKMFEASNKEITRVCKIIKKTFENFNVDEVKPVEIAEFVDQWDGQRMAQIMLSRLSDFFAWCVRKGLRDDNPCASISTEAPRKRSRYITDKEFHKIRDALLVGDDRRENPSGQMVRCYVDLCYLFYQRTTEIRLLKWSDVSEAGVFFKPTKTEQSSGAKVLVPLSASARATLAQAREIGRTNAVYVINTLRGKPYAASGLRSAWDRACARAGVLDATLKDIRAKAATDAEKQGYTRKQIQVGLAHTDEQMTESYIKNRETPVSEVMLELPQRIEVK